MYEILIAMEFKVTCRIILIFSFCVVGAKCHCDAKKYKDDHIVPDIISNFPQGELKVKYGSNNIVRCSSEIPRNMTENQPILEYLASGTSFHTLAMINPDAPDPQRPVFAQYLHWEVMNIPGTQVDDGKTVIPYMPPSPPPYSNAHRYILLVYEQPFYIFAPDTHSARGRSNFNITRLELEFHLGTAAIAGTFFYVRHDKQGKLPTM